MTEHSREQRQGLNVFHFAFNPSLFLSVPSFKPCLFASYLPLSLPFSLHSTHPSLSLSPFLLQFLSLPLTPFHPPSLHLPSLSPFLLPFFLPSMSISSFLKPPPSLPPSAPPSLHTSLPSLFFLSHSTSPFFPHSLPPSLFQPHPPLPSHPPSLPSFPTLLPPSYPLFLPLFLPLLPSLLASFLPNFLSIYV